MTEPDLRSYFATTYPNLTEAELDICCTNMLRFVRTVLAIMEYNEQPKKRDDLPELPDSTL